MNDINKKQPSLFQPTAKDIEEDNYQRRLSLQAEIPPRYREASFANYQSSHPHQAYILQLIQQYGQMFKEQRERGISMLWYGNPGTGKTYLAWCLYRQLAFHYAVKVLSLQQLIDGCQPNSQENIDGFRVFYEHDLLIIDEVDIDYNPRTFQAIDRKNFLFELIDARYQRANPTILIANRSVKELNFTLGEKTIDRILHNGYVIYFDWASYRRGGPKEQPSSGVSQ